MRPELSSDRRRDGRLRIIGGRYRGRKLPVPAQPGLRPTGDRVRETLFNWLQPAIAGARCLDLFAGSGALGFEAASRGAVAVIMIERSAALVRLLRANADALAAEQIQVCQADAPHWLAETREQFDIVFLDPPFNGGLLGPSCALLNRHRRLAPGALVYLEAPAQRPLPVLPAAWSLIRDKHAGQVRFALARIAGEDTAE